MNKFTISPPRRTTMADRNRYIEHRTDNAGPVAVPLVYRVGGADEHIGHAVVQVENGVLNVVGTINISVEGLKLLDLGATMFTGSSPLDEDIEHVLSIRNNRPKPTHVTLTEVKDQKETHG